LLLEPIWTPSQCFKPIPSLNTSPKIMELPTCVVMMAI
jgi:hypothetical protein